MCLDDGDGHDVKDAPWCPYILDRKFVVATAFVISRLDVLVYLSAIRTFQIEPIFSMRFNGSADRLVSEEYRHEHYTACALRIGRTLEHVVYPK
jgi:hypothetical protein